MVEHDRHVGMILDKLDELGIADDTIVMYSTDNGPHYNSWPDAAITPFRSEKNSNWEGAYRVPAFLRWPAKWQAGVTLNGIVAHQDMLTTFLAAAGEPDVAAKCRAGYEAGGKTFKVILDGKDMNAYLAGEADESPRDRFFYVNDDAELVALRVGDWKFIFREQRARQLAHVARPVRRAARAQDRQPAPRPLRARARRLQHLLRLDHRPHLHGRAGAGSRAEAIEEFAEFPPRQKPASFSLDRVLDKLQEAGGSQS